MSRGFPSMTALLGLLAIAGYQNRDKIAELLKDLTATKNDSGVAGQISAPGQLSGLRDLVSGLNLDSILNGGLGDLVKQFGDSGQKEVADSWVGKGANREVAPTDVKRALDPDVLQTLSRITGLSEEDLLTRLSRELPDAVDRYTPEGRLPYTQ